MVCNNLKKTKIKMRSPFDFYQTDQSNETYDINDDNSEKTTENLSNTTNQKYFK